MHIDKCLIATFPVNLSLAVTSEQETEQAKWLKHWRLGILLPRCQVQIPAVTETISTEVFCFL
jgi:lysine/ornithine N-monooxygenase